MPDFPILWTLRNKNSIEEDFVFIRVDAAFNPDARSFINKIKVRFINPMKLIGIPTIINHAKRDFRLTRVYNNIPQWKGTIGYDLIDNTYNMGASFHIFPLIYINKTLATEILNNLDGAIVDYYINQRYNTSVESYNVIGQLNGTDPSKTVIVDCLYDSWWCQGTGDAAIGMATVLGIAKYFTENNITPKYNIKFIGFCGEESGLRGAWHYEDTHKDEDIPYVIDLNQIGFYQIEPRLNLNIMANKLTFLNEVWKIAKKTDYKKIVDNTAGIIPVLDITGAPSDDQIFAMNRPLKCRTVCFIKSYDWVLHHRDGEKHTEGDVLKYFDWADVSATGEIALNITIYLTVEK